MVFDCDGLLVDSRACWEAAYREVLGGREPSAEDSVALNGASVPYAAAQLAVDESALRASLARTFASRPPPTMPGARALVRAVHGRAAMAVATNAPREIAIGAVERVGLLAYLEAVVSAEQTPAPKPAPHVYLAACRILRIDPSDAVALEDSPTGVKSAQTAGLTVVYVASDDVHADLCVPNLTDPRLLDLLAADAPRGRAARNRQDEQPA